MHNHKTASGKAVHKLPADLKKVIDSKSTIVTAWQDLTPLARNEWICWVTSAKKPETRAQRIQRTKTELLEGMRRPCCWLGCIHRTDKAISPSVRAILNRQSKKSKK